MKTLKKLFSVSAIVALLGTLAPMYAFGANYSDELNEAYAYAYKNGITTMKTIDAADMYGSLTRVAMAKMIANYATTVLGLEPDTSAKCTFTDVTAALDAQYDNGVTKACQLGLMGQNITAFRPNDLVTRAEFGTTLSRALNAGKDELKDMNAADPYYKEHLNFLKSEGIMTKIDNPNMTEVRGYVMLMMMRADDSYTPAEGCTAEELLKCITADDYDACIASCTGPEGGDEPVNPGYAKVTTKAASTQTVALNAVEKKIGTVTLTAGENDTTVTNIEITKSGLGDPEDILSIRLMKGDEYVTKGNYSATKRTATLRFSPKLAIKAGKSETFDVVVSLSGANANGQHDFSVTAVTVANGSFGGTPAKLGSLVTTNYSVESIDVDLKASNSEIKAGDENVELATIELTSKKTEAKISSVTVDAEAYEDSIEIGANAELKKVFKNVKAYINNEEVGTVVLNDESIVINGLNQTAKKGKKITITLKGDVIYVGGGEDIVFSMGANYVNATETNTNERMSSEIVEQADDTALSVQGVDLELKNLTTKTQKFAPGQQDVVLLDLELSAGSDLEVTAYGLIYSGDIVDYFEEDTLKLYIDGVDYDLSDEYYKEDDWFTADEGSKISIQVKGDLKDLTDEVFEGAELPIPLGTITFKVFRVKNLENNKTVLIDPVKEKEGHTTKIDAGSVTIKDTLKVSNNLLEEGKTSDVLGFSIKAKSEKITITGFDFTFDGILIEGDDDTDDIEVIKEIALYKKGSSSAIKTVSYDSSDWAKGSGTVTISTNQSINADDTAEFVLKATLNDGSVEVLGQTITGSLSAMYGETESSVSITKTSDLGVEESYQISSVKPTVKVTKNGKKVIVEITNGSEYDIDLDQFGLEVIGNINANGNNPFEAALGSGDWTIEDVDGNAIAGEAEYENSIATVDFDDYTVDAGETETFVVVMPQKANILSDYYDAAEKSARFVYLNDDDEGSDSQLIKATYNN